MLQTVGPYLISTIIGRAMQPLDDWRRKKLSELRALIEKADAAIVEEVKWRKPSNPAGVPVWSHDGIVCIGEPLKNAVRLTFPKGAAIKDPKHLFNARLDSNSVRAIDFREGGKVDEGALRRLILEAVRLNTLKAPKGAQGSAPQGASRTVRPVRRDRSAAKTIS